MNYPDRGAGAAVREPLQSSHRYVRISRRTRLPASRTSLD